MPTNHKQQLSLKKTSIITISVLFLVQYSRSPLKSPLKILHAQNSFGIYHVSNKIIMSYARQCIVYKDFSTGETADTGLFGVEPGTKKLKPLFKTSRFVNWCL